MANPRRQQRIERMLKRRIARLEARRSRRAAFREVLGSDLEEIMAAVSEAAGIDGTIEVDPDDVAEALGVELGDLFGRFPRLKMAVSCFGSGGLATVVDFLCGSDRIGDRIEDLQERLAALGT